MRIHFHEVVFRTFSRCCGLPPVELASVTVKSHGLGILGHEWQGAYPGAVPVGGVDEIQVGICKAVSVDDAVHFALHVNSEGNPVVAACQHVADCLGGAVFHIDSVQDAVTQTIHGFCCDVIGQLSHRIHVCSQNGDLFCLRVNLTEFAILREGIDVICRRIECNNFGRDETVAVKLHSC